MLKDADELPHAPNGAPRWKENYFLLGRDDATGTTVYIHLERYPERGEVKVKSFVEVGGSRASVSRTHRSTNPLQLPGVELGVDEPFRQWQARVDLLGVAEQPPGWSAAHEIGETPFGFDIRVDSTLGPMDWGPVAAALGKPDIILDHYELPCTWTGEVRCGDQRVRTSGLLVRDHSWGPRDLTQFDLAFWNLAVFDDAKVFVSATTILIGSQYVGFTFVDTGAGATLHPQSWVRLSGVPEPHGYAAASGRCAVNGRDEVTDVEVKTPVAVGYPGMGAGHYIFDAMGVARWGQQTGFGLVELNRH